MPMPVLARREDGVGGVEADDLLDLLPHPFRISSRQIDLVDDRHDLMVMLDRLIDVGEGLGLDPLRRIDDEEGAFAGGEGAGHLIGEVDVAGSVHQVELIALPLEPHGLGLDGDPPLALDVHVVEHLGVAAHLPVGEPARRLDQPIGKRRFSVINVSYDTEVTNFFQIS